jgi:hypothetical protein
MQELIKVEVRLAPDLALDETVRIETTPLVESSVRAASQARWEVPGNQSADLVEAFTRKTDGRIIPADLHDLATQDGVVGQAMSFVDLKVQQISFRDVAVDPSLGQRRERARWPARRASCAARGGSTCLLCDLGQDLAAIRRLTRTSQRADTERSSRAATASTLQRVIWIATYPKSGNTWTRTLVHNLMAEIRASHPRRRTSIV